MTMLRTLTITLASLLALGGCTSFKDIRISATTTPGVDFADVQTYAWVASAAIVRDPEREWTPPDLDVGGEITFLANRELRAHGMTEVAADPDAFVIYAIGVDMKALPVKTPEDETGQPMPTPRGEVMVILADPDTGEIMWSASATADLTKAPSVDLAKQRLDYAIRRMFERFPRVRRGGSS